MNGRLKRIHKVIYLNISYFKLQIFDFNAISRVERLTDDECGFDVLNGELG